MAFRDALGPNPTGLNQFMNVTRKVGPDEDCANHRNDVEAVQRLINIILPSTKIFRLGFGLCSTSGMYDALTGFYIYKFQRSVLQGFTHSVIDGCVSTARGVNYGAATIFTIVALNQSASMRNRMEYEQFMKDYPTPPRGFV